MPSPPDSEDATSPLDEHSGFVLGIDDACRRGYSLLALGAMVCAASALLVTGTAVWSWSALWMLPVVFFVAVVVGRMTLLARYEARLRGRVRRYCRDLGLDELALTQEAREQGRYEFFVKLFSAAPSP